MKQDTKTNLLNTALELIWANSYGTVSVDDICAKAKAKKGSFYHYFPSKAELTRAALEHVWEQVRAEFDQLFSPHTEPLARFEALAKASYLEQQQMLEKYGYVVGCPFTLIGIETCAAEDGLSEVAWDILQRCKRYFSIAIRDAIEAGTLKPIDVKLATDRLFTYYLGAYAQARLANSLAPMADVYDSWIAILHDMGAQSGATSEARAASPRA